MEFECCRLVVISVLRLDNKSVGWRWLAQTVCYIAQTQFTSIIIIFFYIENAFYADITQVQTELIRGDEKIKTVKFFY